MSKRYLLVGASSGIGAAVAEQLSGSDSQVIGISRTEGALADISGSEFHACDVCDSNAELPSIEGALDGLAYLPGTINLKPFSSLSEKDYRADWELNFLAATAVIKKYLSNLKESGAGSIVLMSTVAVEQGMPYHASIAAAKGAVEGLTRALAAEFAPTVRVNAVAPSLTDTPLAEKLLNDEKKREHAAQRHPLQSIGEPSTVAEAVTFLLTPHSQWMTGQVLHVDGGLSTLRIL